MNDELADRRLSDLLVVLDRLTGLHRELHGLIREKIERMRTGDAGALRDCAVREEALVKTIREQDGLRRQLTGAIGRSFGINTEVVRRMPLRQLAERIEGRLRRKLTDAAERLRRVITEVSELNRIAALIAQQVLLHLRGVFEAMAAPDQRPDTYSPRGRAVPGETRGLFEMTG